MEPHNDSKVFAGNHVSDVPDSCLLECGTILAKTYFKPLSHFALVVRLRPLLYKEISQLEYQTLRGCKQKK